MKIDKAEIERIIDDFETKAEQTRPYVSMHLKVADAYKDIGKKEGLEYAAAVLRQVLHG